MSEQLHDDLGPGTDVRADLGDLAGHEKPATSDPDEMTEDPGLGGTAGDNAGGAG